MSTEQGRHLQGFSLIEILVALAIGSLLVLGLVEVFAASRAAYQLSTGLARVQENGRFAMDFLQRDLRMAGHLGCVNDQARFLPSNTSGTRLALASTFLTTAQQQAVPTNYAAAQEPLRFDVGIRGYEANGTSPGAMLTLVTTPAPAADATSWTPAIHPVLFAHMNAAGVGRPVAGSDVVALRYFLPSGAQMTAFDPASLPPTITVENAQLPRLTDGAVNPSLFGVSDCINAAVFQASNVAGNVLTVGASGLNQSTLTGNESFVAGQARVYRAESVVYYIGLNQNAVPSLFRLRYRVGPGVGVLVPVREELVEGIESLQLQYGQDSRTDPTDTPTGNIGNSVLASGVQVDTPSADPAADAVNAWRRVGLVQVGIVARSSDPAAAPQRDSSVPQLSALGVVIDAPGDTFYRAVYEDSIAVRNRLFGN